MKKIRAWVFAVLMAVVLCACGEEQEQELADISTVEGDGYVAIIWEERTYVPFCVVSKNDCGALIGYRDGDTSDRVCEYKDYPSNEWIANYLANLQPTYNNTTDKEKTAITNFSSRAAFLGGPIVETIIDLLIMFAKTTNLQEAYGYGNCSGYDASQSPTYGVRGTNNHETGGIDYDKEPLLHGREEDHGQGADAPFRGLPAAEGVRFHQ